MATERDLSALLPPMPPPRPDAREAAIGEAMRRFDGEAPTPKPSTAARRKSLLGRPQLAALAAAGLVATIGLPLWLSGDLTPHVPSRMQSESAPAEAPAEPPALADVAPATPEEESRAFPAPTSPASQAPVTAAPARPIEAREDARARMETVPPPAAAAPAPVVAPAPPPPPALAPPPAAYSPVADEAANDVVVTGARVSRRAAAKSQSEQRREAAFAEQGLSGSVRAERAPATASDWLGRGLANARAGDDKRALADLDRAVKLAPDDADIRHQRSLVLRRLGKIERAEADAAKAAELDPRYKTGN